MGLLSSAFGLTHCVSFLPILDFTNLGSTFSLHSLCRIESPAFALDLLSIGSMPSIRLFSYVGFAFALFGLARMESLMLVSDSVTLGLTIFLRSLSFLGASVMMTDLLHLGSSMPMRTFACLNSAFLLFGLYRVDSSVSMLDFALIASSHSLRSFARPDRALSVLNFLQLELLPLSSLPTLVLDFLRPGSGTSLRLFAHFGFIASLFGLSWLGFVFSLSTTEFSHLGLPSSCRSFVCLDRTASALDLLYLGMVLPFRTFAQLRSQIFASGLSRLASALSVLEHVNSDLMSLS